MQLSLSDAKWALVAMAKPEDRGFGRYIRKQFIRGQWKRSLGLFPEPAPREIKSPLREPYAIWFYIEELREDVESKSSALLFGIDRALDDLASSSFLVADRMVSTLI